MTNFAKPFTQQESIPQAGIERAVEILQTGRLHRYNLAEGETSEASLLEQEYAHYQGADLPSRWRCGFAGLSPAIRCWPMPIRWRRCRGRSIMLAPALY